MSGEPEVWGFALFLAAAFALAYGALRLIDWLVDRSPMTEPEPSRLDALDQPWLAACDQRLCSGFAVVTITDGEGATRHVCSSCFASGVRQGWWVSFADRRGGAS